jgi:hypothetical protein
LELNKGNLKANKVIQDAPVKFEKSRKNLGLGGKLNALLRTKKQKRTRTGMFHSLHLAIHDYRLDDCVQLLETLSDSTLVKKRPKDANRAFLHAMVSRMSGVCLKMLEKGFPVNINNPVMGSHNHGSSEKFYFPSYFQMAVAFELVEVIKAMIKLKADVNLSWYQVTPLQNACLKGNEIIIRLLIENGANPNQSLGLGDYLMLSKLKPRHRRSPSSSSPDEPASLAGSVKSTKEYPQQVFQKSPAKLEKEYIENKQIYLFEMAAMRGHMGIASYLLDQYF